MNRKFYFLLGLVGFACTSPPAAVHRSKKSNESFRQIFVKPGIRVRRPEGIRPDPQVGPGAKDYQAIGVNENNWNCETLEELLLRLKLPLVEMNNCVQEVQKKAVGLEGWQLRYVLTRKAQPVWSLLPLETENIWPECVKKVLGVIPLPREIVFLNPKAADSPVLECYTSSLDLEGDRWMGLKVPTSDFELAVDFPLRDQVDTLRDFEQTLKSWMLTPFFVYDTEGERSLRARPVALNFCQRCFGEKELKLDRKIPVPVWPPLGPSEYRNEP